MSIIVEPDQKKKTIIVTFSEEDAEMALRNGVFWLEAQLKHIVIPRGKR